METVTNCGRLDPMQPMKGVERLPCDLPIAVIGAGPVGLAAAAHLLERGLEPVILEAGSEAGAAVREWGHVPMFSPWRFNVDRAATALLRKRGWNPPNPDGFPTGDDLAERYLAPLATTPEIAPRLRLGARVVGVMRSGIGKVRTAGREKAPFELRFVNGMGRESRLFARGVIDATGTWSVPNPAGAGGLAALGEGEARDRIRYGMPDVLGRERRRYAGRRVLVAGGGHSAVGSLLDLARLASEEPKTRILWAVRGRRDIERAYGGGAADQLPQRGELGSRLRDLNQSGRVTVLAPFAIDAIERLPQGSLQVTGLAAEGTACVTVDELIVATGLRPDLGFLSELRLDLDPALECPRVLAPLIDPNIHSCGTVRPHGALELAHPEPDFFMVGMKSYGRAPTFLLATGYEQARSVAAYLAGDVGAARRVELELPETGVCSGPVSGPAECCGADTASAGPGGAASPDDGCCGGPAPAESQACCVRDAEAKASGRAGCGCGASRGGASVGASAESLPAAE